MQQCGSLVQRVANSSFKGLQCSACYRVNLCWQDRPRVLVLNFVVVMNHGVHTKRQLHRLHLHEGISG